MDDERLPQWLEDPPRPLPDDAALQRMRSSVAAGMDTRPAPLRSRLIMLAGAGVAASVVAGLVLVPRGEAEIAHAATPELLSHQVGEGRREADLRGYAARVSRLPATSTYVDGDHRVVTRSWSLFTRIDGEQVDSAVIPQRRDLQWRADGSGTLDAVTEPPVFPAAEYREAWEAEGRPGEDVTVVTEQAFAPGEYRPQFPASLPARSAQLVPLLEAGHPIDDLGTAELFVAIADLYREQTPAPRVRSTLLGLIDRAADVDDLGQVTDRSGRPGRAVAVTSAYSGLETRYVLTFHVRDGSLLSFEQVLTGSVGKLDVPSPAVISYELYDQELSH